jgi:hypothetical protein
VLLKLVGLAPKSKKVRYTHFEKIILRKPPHSHSKATPWQKRMEATTKMTMRSATKMAALLRQKKMAMEATMMHKVDDRPRLK